jgi:hypothetical protein
MGIVVYSMGYLLICLMGVLLGLTGAGGGLLSLPILRYLFGFSYDEASFLTLILVGSTSTIGSFRLTVSETIQWKELLIVGIPSSLMVFIVRYYLLPLLPDVFFQLSGLIVTKNFFFMMILSIFMIFAGWEISSDQLKNIVPSDNYSTNFIFYLSVGIGFFTGLLGVGGGFLIVPILVIFLKKDLRNASAYSLLIISLNCFSGIISDFSKFKIYEMAFITKIVLISIFGLLFGIKISKMMNKKIMKKYYGYLLMILGISFFSFELMGMAK